MGIKKLWYTLLGISEVAAEKPLPPVSENVPVKKKRNSTSNNLRTEKPKKAK